IRRHRAIHCCKKTALQWSPRVTCLLILDGNPRASPEGPAGGDPDPAFSASGWPIARSPLDARLRQSQPAAVEVGFRSVASAGSSPLPAPWRPEANPSPPSTLRQAEPFALDLRPSP